MATRIKPKVEEISLAFNPANKRKFILHKEKGGETMKHAISILEKDDQADHEKEFLAFLKDQKIADDVAEAMAGAYRLIVISKDKLPKKFASSLDKSFPDVSELFTVKKDEKDEKKIRTTIEKELRVPMEKEIRAAVEKEMGMSKDVEIQKLSETIKTLQKETDETKKLLIVEKDARRLTELVKEIETYEVPGDIAKKAKDLLEVEKLDPDLAKGLMASYKEFGVSLKAAESLREIGSSASGMDDSAFSELQKIAKAKMEKDEALTETVAFSQAAKENPALYKEYNADHFKRQYAH